MEKLPKAIGLLDVSRALKSGANTAFVDAERLLQLAVEYTALPQKIYDSEENFSPAPGLNQITDLCTEGLDEEQIYQQLDMNCDNITAAYANILGQIESATDFLRTECKNVGEEIEYFKQTSLKQKSAVNKSKTKSENSEEEEEEEQEEMEEIEEDSEESLSALDEAYEHDDCDNENAPEDKDLDREGSIADEEKETGIGMFDPADDEEIKEGEELNEFENAEDAEENNEEEEEEEEEVGVWTDKMDTEKEKEIEAKILAAEQFDVDDGVDDENEGLIDDNMGDMNDIILAPGQKLDRATFAIPKKNSKTVADETKGASSAGWTHEDENEPGLSDYERAQRRMRNKIAELEKKMLEQQDWKMAGEVSFKGRPVDALLSEVKKNNLDFDNRRRPVLVLTQEINNSIEDIIKLRIRDGRFNDPVYRKEIDVEELQQQGQKKPIEISDKQSAQSLGDEYATMALESAKKKIGLREEVNEKVKELRDEVLSLFRDLSVELNGYCSLH